MAADVVIVGGGMAGCALAFGLAATHRVTVLEKNAEGHSQARVGESLPAAALRSLRLLGLGEAIQASSHGDYHGVISVWGHATPAHKDFISGIEGSGLHLDRGLLNSNIKAAATAAGVTFIHNVELQSLTYTPCSESSLLPNSSPNDETDAGNWSVAFSLMGQRRQLNTRFVVDSSGRSGVVARKLGIKRTHLDRAVAIHSQCPRVDGSTETTLPLQGNTLIESSEHGWWYRAPLPSGNDIVSFHTDSDLRITKTLQDPNQWLASLSETQLISTGLDWGKIKTQVHAQN